MLRSHALKNARPEGWRVLEDTASPHNTILLKDDLWLELDKSAADALLFDEAVALFAALEAHDDPRGQVWLQSITRFPRAHIICCPPAWPAPTVPPLEDTTP